MEIESITVDNNNISKSIVPFKRENNNLQLNDNTANIIDATSNNNNFTDQNIAGGSDDKSGIDVPVIDSSNKNSDDHIIAVMELGLNAL